MVIRQSLLNPRMCVCVWLAVSFTLCLKKIPINVWYLLHVVVFLFIKEIITNCVLCYNIRHNKYVCFDSFNIHLTTFDIKCSGTWYMYFESTICFSIKVCNEITLRVNFFFTILLKLNHPLKYLSRKREYRVSNNAEEMILSMFKKKGLRHDLT